jgi:nicotinate phosphoribosyltransferase
MITSLLDNDFYKFTMQHAVYDNFKDLDVKYKFVCRNNDVDLSYLKQQVEDEITNLSNLTFSSDEIDFLYTIIPYCNSSYLEYLKNFKLNVNCVNIFTNDDGLNIEVEGKWCDTILFEIYVLSTVNGLYFEKLKYNIDKQERKIIQRLYWLLEELDRRNLKNYKLIEFGTRRRLSRYWHHIVSKQLRNILPKKIFLGTSNCDIAKNHNELPLGTTAHEWYSAGQVLFPDNPNKMLDVWDSTYNGALNTCLTDTMTTDWFIKNITRNQVSVYNFRQDSGEPIEWINKIVDLLDDHGIPFNNKKVFFSDSLNFEKSLDIAEYMEHIYPKFSYMFGIGTFLTNFAEKPLNIVMKLVEVNGTPVAKISDNIGKAVCTDKNKLNYYIAKYGIKV